MIKHVLRRFKNETSGQFAVWTAVIALPMTIGVSVALDSHLAAKEKTRLKSALDAAALAAITNQTLTIEGRAGYAKDRFQSNMDGEAKAKLKVVNSSSERVELTGTVEVPTLMSGLTGRNRLKVSAVSATELVKGSTVCMLTLDPDSPRSFEVTSGASLDASTCGIQVNSRDKQASIVDHGGKALAQSFCIAGGARGNHYPYANTECSLLENPYSDVQIPDAGACVDEAELQALVLDWRSGRNAVEQHEVLEYQRWADAEAAGRIWYPTFFEKNHLKPGNYCNGLFLEGKEFNLDPGVYHITGGSLVFGLGTELVGEGVTFVVHDKVEIDIRDGSILNIKGPSEGPMRGLVIAQNLGNKPIISTLYPNATTSISEGGILNLLGTVYLPSHQIEFLGGSLSRTTAPATSFIAHRISIRDGANLNVAVDHIEADIPPILPRSDDGARLVK